MNGFAVSFAVNQSETCGTLSASTRDNFSAWLWEFSLVAPQGFEP